MFSMLAPLLILLMIPAMTWFVPGKQVKKKHLE
jgi:hypothetical protein